MSMHADDPNHVAESPVGSRSGSARPFGSEVPRHCFARTSLVVLLCMWGSILLLSCIDIYLRIPGERYPISDAGDFDKVAFWFALGSPVPGVSGIIWGSRFARILGITVVLLGIAWFVRMAMLLAQL